MALPGEFIIGAERPIELPGCSSPGEGAGEPLQSNPWAVTAGCTPPIGDSFTGGLEGTESGA